MLVLLTKDWQKFSSEAEMKILEKFGDHARKFTLSYFCMFSFGIYSLLN